MRDSGKLIDIWIRVSTKDQAKGESPGHPEQKVFDFMPKPGMEDLRTSTISKKDNSRPNLFAMDTKWTPSGFPAIFSIRQQPIVRRSFA